MKNIFIYLAVMVLILGSVSTLSGQKSMKKIEEARELVKETREELIEAENYLSKVLNDSISEIKKDFNKEFNKKIIAFEKIISDLKFKINNENSDNKNFYKNELTGLEQKKSALKKKISTYKEIENDNWIHFTNELKDEIDELEKNMSLFSSIIN